MSFWKTVMENPEGVAHGRRLMPRIIDDTSRKDPERTCLSFPRSTNLALGFQDVNYKTFANAINKTAHFIHKEIGRSSMFETILYMGYPDIRHYIVSIALMKTGHKLLLSSHRNSITVHADLIKKSQCTILIYTASFPVSGILEKCRMETLCMPELDYLLDDTEVDLYPYPFTWEEAKNHPCLVVQTLNSGGMPKPIVYTHATLALVDAHHLVPPLNGRPVVRGAFMDVRRRIFCALPIFHAAGIISITQSIFNGNVVVIGPPGIAGADTFGEVIDYGNIDAAYCLPVTLEETATRRDILPKLQKLTYVVFTGGSLYKDHGDVISQHTHLLSEYGSTETGILVQHLVDREDWDYLCLNPTVNGIRMRPAGRMHEVVFHRNADYLQGIFTTHPALDEYVMSDLLSEHPSKPNHWRVEGRTDDVIVLRNGASFSPKLHQSIISRHPAVKNCIVVGMGRDQPTAIIELRSAHYTEEMEKQELLAELIWPYVLQANRVTDSACQLNRNGMLFARKEKPFAITGSGTVQRKATIEMYGSEIEALYTSLGDQNN